MEDLRKFLNETNEMVRDCVTENKITIKGKANKKVQKEIMKSLSSS